MWFWQLLNISGCLSCSFTDVISCLHAISEIIAGWAPHLRNVRILLFFLLSLTFLLVNFSTVVWMCPCFFGFGTQDSYRSDIICLVLHLDFYISSPLYCWIWPLLIILQVVSNWLHAKQTLQVKIFMHMELCS